MMGKICTKKNAPPTGGHVFQATGTIFELVQNIIWTKLLTNFYDDRTINMASRVLTMFNYSYTKIRDWPDRPESGEFRYSERKMPRPLGGHVFPPTGTIFKLIQDIIGTNHLTKFHDDRTINVASRVKNAPPPYIIRTNLLNKFHEDRKINVASRVLTRFYYSHIWTTSPPPLRPSIIGINLLTKFHEDRTINVASRVKNVPPLGNHVFQANLTIFELIQDIIATNLLTKFH
ncbi:hypothetical protein DPMN_038310 [Dreissena polymorpha]|uniref:Uncharacterized protein n=1 Tax=Dreissena polymorpha TaxID=45954 RepID=A0A9D4MF64_DREPO|nr:hypothetical protein DPMN_038310 [Dreissena polymorpha]